MLFVATRRAASVLVLGACLTFGCAGRWQPATAHEVPTQVEPRAAYATVLEVAAAKQYSVVSKDPAASKLRLQSHSNSKSFLDVVLESGRVRLSAAGALVRDGKVHKQLSRELNAFEKDLKQRFASGGAPAPSASEAAQPVAETSAAPSAWSEPAYDPSVWGNGNFTCLPVRVPADHQAALSLRLTNGEKADLELSLAYDPGLCRSPAQCKQAGGCPALGIGDTERVSRLAGRLSRGEVGSEATLLDGGKPVATIDLKRHGSIAQALLDMKR